MSVGVLGIIAFAAAVLMVVGAIAVALAVLGNKKAGER